jgi:hypothetical protein
MRVTGSRDEATWSCSPDGEMGTLVTPEGLRG